MLILNVNLVGVELAEILHEPKPCVGALGVVQVMSHLIGNGWRPLGGVVDFVSTTRALCSRAPPCGGVSLVKCLFKPCSGLKLFLAF